MKYRILILLLFSTLCTNVSARGKGSAFTCGLEWGYIATLNTGYHYNFFAPEGYRVNVYGNSFRYFSNAEVYLHAGYNLSPAWNLSMYIGYEGIADIHKAIPISLRATRYFKENIHGDRWFTFADIGSGICLKKPAQDIFTGKLGGGYRIALSPETFLDFMMSARFTCTHPQIIYYNEPIRPDYTNRNNAYIGALSVSMALSF